MPKSWKLSEDFAVRIKDAFLRWKFRPNPSATLLGTDVDLTHVNLFRVGLLPNLIGESSLTLIDPPTSFQAGLIAPVFQHTKRDGQDVYPEIPVLW